MGSYQQASLLLAELAIYRGQHQLALFRLDEMLHPKEKKQPAQIDTVQNNALELYLLIRENQHDSTSLAIWGHALWLQQQRRYSTALDTLAALACLNGASPLYEPVSFLRIELLRQKQRFSEAITICRALLDDPKIMRPDLALKTMGELHEEMADIQQAQQLYESFLEKYPQSIYIEQVRVRIRQLEKQVL